jgi:urease gamma subunit
VAEHLSAVLVLVAIRRLLVRLQRGLTVSLLALVALGKLEPGQTVETLLHWGRHQLAVGMAAVKLEMMLHMLAVMAALAAAAVLVNVPTHRAARGLRGKAMTAPRRSTQVFSGLTGAVQAAVLTRRVFLLTPAEPVNSG